MSRAPKAQRRPALVQARDREILHSLFRHRWLRADQVQALHFRKAGLRATRERLRRLWLAGFVDREFLPLRDRWDSGLPKWSPAAALYCLAAPGAELVAADLDLPLSAVPHTLRANRRGFATLCHHLLVTDFLVALEVAGQTEPAFPLRSAVREGALWERLRERQRQGEPLPRLFVVPDAAFTLGRPGARAVTFYLEVVRADPRGGLQSLGAKLARYVELNRAGFFRLAWGHEHVRAVLLLTPTAARAASLRAFARLRLAAGRLLFWFGSYEEADGEGRIRSTLTAERLAAPRFLDLDGGTHSLAEAFIPNATLHAHEAQ